MKTANEKLLDLAIRRNEDSGKYGNKLVRDIRALLADAEDDILAKIRKFEDRGPRTKTRIDNLLDAIRQMNAGTYANAYSELLPPLIDLAKHEVEGNVDMLNRATPVTLDVVTPSVAQITALVADKPFHGALLAEWWDGLEASMAAKTAQQIRLGMVSGESMDQITRRLIGSAKDYEPGIWRIVKNQTDNIVRSSVMHVSNQAAAAVYSANADIIKGEMWCATLDRRTCPACGARDGKTYPLGTTDRPIIHLGDRCFMTPILKTWKEMGIPLDEMPEGSRASMNGAVPSTLKYDEWMKGRDRADILADLGTTRGKLYLDGKLPLSALSDGKGSIFSIATLKERQGLAFDRAFGKVGALPHGPANGTFTYQKNLEPAKKLVSDLFGIQVGEFGSFTLTKELELQSVNRIGAELQRLENIMPGVSKLSVKPMSSSTYPGRELSINVSENNSLGLFTAQTNEIAIGPITDQIKPAVLGESYSWHSVYNDPLNPLRHELAHSFHSNGLSMDEFDDWFNIYKSKPSDFWERTVSEYGGGSATELFAESFTAYTCTAYEKGMLPEQIENFLKKVLPK